MTKQEWEKNLVAASSAYKGNTHTVMPESWYDNSLNQARRENRQHKGERFVALVLEDQAYGGREEGGWWYSVGEVEVQIWTKPWSPRYNRLLQIEQEENEGRPPISSVCSVGILKVVEQDQPVEGWPQYRPHYE